MVCGWLGSDCGGCGSGVPMGCVMGADRELVWTDRGLVYFFTHLPVFACLLTAEALLAAGVSAEAVCRFRERHPDGVRIVPAGPYGTFVSHFDPSWPSLARGLLSAEGRRVFDEAWWAESVRYVAATSKPSDPGDDDAESKRAWEQSRRAAWDVFGRETAPALAAHNAAIADAWSRAYLADP